MIRISCKKYILGLLSAILLVTMASCKEQSSGQDPSEVQTVINKTNVASQSAAQSEAANQSESVNDRQVESQLADSEINPPSTNLITTQENTKVITDNDLTGLEILTDEEFFTSITEQQAQEISDRANPNTAAIWPNSNIFVCWEETPDETSELRSVVRAAVQQTWEEVSALVFKGWGKCHEESSGIRIGIKDVGPHVKELGQFIKDQKNGMVLNFTYQNWGVGCQERIESCTRIIAVHEFGHAIGFAHEQNRPDTPSGCDERQGSYGDNTSLTPWDKDSVMNYCNPIYGNNGELSSYDIVATKHIYGDV